MFHITRTTSENPAFVELVQQLDRHLSKINGEEDAFFSQYNKIDLIQHVVVAFDADSPIGCGAVKAYGDNTMEVKRMYTLPEYRGKGIASQILTELESWSKEMGYSACVLETAKALEPAVRLYHKSGYNVIPNYGQYAGVESSVCFEKVL